MVWKRSCGIGYKESERKAYPCHIVGALVQLNTVPFHNDTFIGEDVTQVVDECLLVARNIQDLKSGEAVAVRGCVRCNCGMRGCGE